MHIWGSSDARENSWLKARRRLIELWKLQRCFATLAGSSPILAGTFA